MTTPIFNPQPNYSGVTIQISNPTVNTNPVGSGSACVTSPQNCSCPQCSVSPAQISQCGNQSLDTGYAKAYPVEYYLNNYNYQGNGDFNAHDNGKKINDASSVNEQANDTETSKSDNIETQNNNTSQKNVSDKENSFNDVQSAVLKHYDTGKVEKDNDMSKSSGIINDIDERELQMNEEKKNTKETRIVALTDEYIKSLENYLNNPNDEIRLMASKEILTRLDEDKDRYDDAALNALLNKMLQDPSKLVRIAALSAFGSQLACGNDYTIQLLQNIQSNPSADKEDILQAADILLKMSAGTEVKNIPVPQESNKK